jgi:glycerophosphoryl diester phosphodiesterase
MLKRTLLWMVLAVTMTEAATRIQVHGHRGARAMRPENTIPAFQYAIGIGVDVLELDMAVTKDNVLVVSHDPTLLPKICEGPKPGAAIHELTLAQLREYDCGKRKNPDFPKQQPVPGTRVPSLDEVFALGRGNNVQFNIETKIFLDRPELTPSPEEFVKLVLAEVRKHHLEKRIILQSFDFRTLHVMKKLAPEIRLAALYEGPPKSFVEIAKEADAGIISPHYSLVTKEQVAAAHKSGLEVVPWTANTPADWDKLVDAKVDAIISDDPAALIAYLKAKHLR